MQLIQLGARNGLNQGGAEEFYKLHPANYM